MSTDLQFFEYGPKMVWLACPSWVTWTKVNPMVIPTVICWCINTPVKRQYINALFEMAVCHRKRLATIINFLSFISIDIQGFPFDFGKKSSLALK